jgi:hypothetical protein
MCPELFISPDTEKLTALPVKDCDAGRNINMTEIAEYYQSIRLVTSLLTFPTYHN